MTKLAKPQKCPSKTSYTGKPSCDQNQHNLDKAIAKNNNYENCGFYYNYY